MADSAPHQPAIEPRIGDLESTMAATTKITNQVEYFLFGLALALMMLSILS